MKRSYIFLATGFEEIEALATADVLRRAGMEVTLVSIYDDRMVTGANGITVAADIVFKAADYSDADWLICPGGMPGSENLVKYAPLAALLKEHSDKGGRIAAICAAPAVVLSQLGLLDGKTATCYPGFEKALTQTTMRDTPVVTLDRIITANGPSAALRFALAIVANSMGENISQEVGSGMLFYPRSMNFYF